MSIRREATSLPRCLQVLSRKSNDHLQCTTELKRQRDLLHIYNAPRTSFWRALLHDEHAPLSLSLVALFSVAFSPGDVQFRRCKWREKGSNFRRFFPPEISLTSPSSFAFIPFFLPPVCPFDVAAGTIFHRGMERIRVHCRGRDYARAKEQAEKKNEGTQSNSASR